MIDLKSCIAFANENKVSFLATVEGDQPRVRALGFWFADDTGFYFQIGDIKQMYKQLQANPKTEVCFFKQDNMAGRTLRITGAIDFVNDKKLKEKVLVDRPFLKNFGLTIESAGLIIFRIAHGQAHFWSMETNLKPKEVLEF